MSLDAHPKAQRAGDEALGMWVRAGSWSMRYLTDGFIPAWWVKQQPRGTAKAKRLVEAALWHPAEKDGEKGWQFHEFVGAGRQDLRFGNGLRQASYPSRQEVCIERWESSMTAADPLCICGHAADEHTRHLGTCLAVLSEGRAWTTFCPCWEFDPGPPF